MQVSFLINPKIKDSSLLECYVLRSFGTSTTIYQSARRNDNNSNSTVVVALSIFPITLPPTGLEISGIPQRGMTTNLPIRNHPDSPHDNIHVRQ